MNVSLAHPMTRSRLWLIVTCLLLTLIWFGALQYRELFNPDEGRYAQIPLEMNLAHDHVTPRLNGFKYFEKPAWQYWMTAGAYELFGVHRWSARLWTALSGFASLWLVFITGRRLAGTQAGLLAAAALACTLQFFAFSQILTLDMSVSLFMTLTLAALLGCVDARLTSARRFAWAMTMWAAMALALLSKGLIGIVLPAGVLSAYVLLQRDWRLLAQLRWLPGLVLFAVIAAPWLVLVQLRNPAFFDFFFIHEHFARFAETGHHRAGAWYYFIVLLLVGSMPWSIAYVRALLASWRMTTPRELAINAPRLLLVWTVVITVFFSISRSKLPGYIVPVFPALALLYATWCAQPGRSTRLPVLSLALMGTVLAALPWIVDAVPSLARGAGAYVAYRPLACAAGAGMIATALMAFGVRRRAGAALAVFMIGMLVCSQTLIAGAQTLAERFSSTGLVTRAQASGGRFDRSAAFYSVGLYDQTLPLNIGRAVTLVDYGDEFTFGQEQEPERALTIERFRADWLKAPQAYALVSLQTLERERLAGLPFVTLSSNEAQAIIARRTPTADNLALLHLGSGLTASAASVAPFFTAWPALRAPSAVA